jgi:hypothetical protein
VAAAGDCGGQPYLYLDGVVLKRTSAGDVRNVSLQERMQATA